MLQTMALRIPHRVARSERGICANGGYFLLILMEFIERQVFLTFLYKVFIALRHEISSGESACDRYQSWRRK